MLKKKKNQDHGCSLKSQVWPLSVRWRRVLLPLLRGVRGPRPEPTLGVARPRPASGS